MRASLLRLVLVVGLLSLTEQALGIQLNAADQKLMLQVYNQIRGRTNVVLTAGDKVQPAGSDIHKLTWNAQAATDASNWAESLAKTCQGLSHSVPAGYGQNLNYYGSTQDIGMDVYKSVRGWENEKAVYTDGPCASTCNFAAIGHYTQLVAGRTRSVGCGYGKCFAGGFWKYYTACNYYPAGNMNVGTTAPYTKGTPCTKCAAGTTCDNSYGPHGLCAAAGGDPGLGALPAGPICGPGQFPACPKNPYKTA